MSLKEIEIQKNSHIQLIPFCVCRCHEKTLQIHGRVWKVVVEVNLWPWEPHRMCRGYRGRMKNSLIQLVPTDSTRPFFVFANLWPWEPRIRCRGDKGRMKNSLIELVPYDSTRPFFVFANAKYIVVEVNLWPWEPHRTCREDRGRKTSASPSANRVCKYKKSQQCNDEWWPIKIPEKNKIWHGGKAKSANLGRKN